MFCAYWLSREEDTRIFRNDDKVSQYPYIMATKSFPIGDYKVTFNEASSKVS